MAVVFGGGTPIDFGRKLAGGERIFGDGKTWRGLVGGTLSGAVLGLLLSLPFNVIAPDSSWSFGSPATAFGASAVLALGALRGDLAAPVVKRRLPLPRRAKATGLDRVALVIRALFLSLAGP